MSVRTTLTIVLLGVRKRFVEQGESLLIPDLAWPRQSFHPRRTGQALSVPWCFCTRGVTLSLLGWTAREAWKALPRRFKTAFFSISKCHFQEWVSGIRESISFVIYIYFKKLVKPTIVSSCYAHTSKGSQNTSLWHFWRHFVVHYCNPFIWSI